MAMAPAPLAAQSAASPPPTAVTGYARVWPDARSRLFQYCRDLPTYRDKAAYARANAEFGASEQSRLEGLAKAETQCRAAIEFPLEAVPAVAAITCASTEFSAMCTLPVTITRCRLAGAGIDGWQRVENIWSAQRCTASGGRLTSADQTCIMIFDKVYYGTTEPRRLNWTTRPTEHALRIAGRSAAGLEFPSWAQGYLGCRKSTTNR